MDSARREIFDQNLSKALRECEGDLDKQLKVVKFADWILHYPAKRMTTYNFNRMHRLANPRHWTGSNLAKKDSK